MKIILFTLILTTQVIYSQDRFEDLFKSPLERERKGEVFLSPGPIETTPTSSVFFNINISQNSAPQNEPSVCVSRKNPNRVVAGWRDFRYGIDPNANRRVGYSYSTNGGLTWSVSQILDSTLLPNLTRNSDPVVTVDTAGNFYVAVIAIPPFSNNLTLAVYKSTNGGISFPQAFICSQTGTEDKEWITVDLSQTSPFVNTIYISWTSFSIGGIQLTKSANGGANWSAPVAISDGGGVQGSNICISRNGHVNVAWLGFNGSDATVLFDRSTNGGNSFGTDITAASGIFPSGLPNDVNTFPSIDVDRSTGPRSGWLYIAYADNRNGDCDVFLTKSTNNGLNWSTPVRVNNDAVGNNKIQYWPAIAVNEVGNIAIMFMDSRNDGNPKNTTIECWVARSYDGGVTFTNELVSTEQSPTFIPGSNVRFGDYIDVDYVGQNVTPVWTDERAGGFNMDIFTSEISEVLGITNGNLIPGKYNLLQNYPNPFNPATTIAFALPEQTYVSLKVFDILGREVKNLFEGEYNAGAYSVNFDAGSFNSGLYFYQLKTSSGYSETKKMMLVK